VTCVAPEEYIGTHGDPAFNIAGRAPDFDRVLIGDACISVHKLTVQPTAVDVRPTKLCSSPKRQSNSSSGCDAHVTSCGHVAHGAGAQVERGLGDVEQTGRDMEELYLSDDLGTSGPNLALRLAAYCTGCGTWIGDAELLKGTTRNAQEAVHITHIDMNPKTDETQEGPTNVAESERPWELLRLFKCRIKVDASANHSKFSLLCVTQFLILQKLLCHIIVFTSFQGIQLSGNMK
jgi:hypothetical protein